MNPNALTLARRAGLLVTMVGCAGTPVAVLVGPIRNSERGAAAIILEEELSIHNQVEASFDQSGLREFSDTTVSRRTYIATVEGAAHMSVRLPHGDGQLIASFDGRTILPNGDIVNVDIDHQHETAQPDLDGYFTVRFSGAVVGSVVEYSYRTSNDKWVERLNHVWDEEIPVRVARLRFDSTSGGGLSLFGASSSATAKFDLRGYRLVSPPDESPYIFELTDYSPAPSVTQSDAPHVRLTLSSAQFTKQAGSVNNHAYNIGFSKGYTDSWNDVGHEFWSRINLRVVRAPADLSAPEAFGRDERIDLAWSVVQQKIEHRATVGGRNAQEIWESRVGSDNDRTLLLFAVLRSWGVPAAFLQMPLPNRPDLTEQELPSSDSLGATLVVAENEAGESIILDPMCLGCSVGEYLTLYDGRVGLLVAPPGSRFTPPALSDRPYAAAYFMRVAGQRLSRVGNGER